MKTSNDRAAEIEARARRGAFSECAPAERAINTLLRDVRALTAMLDRIAAVDGVEFDPSQEECIADGVDNMALALHEAETALSRARSKGYAEGIEAAARVCDEYATACAGRPRFFTASDDENAGKLAAAEHLAARIRSTPNPYEATVTATLNAKDQASRTVHETREQRDAARAALATAEAREKRRTKR